MINQMQERYARHFNLKEIGLEGQEKLRQAKVLVIGAGGLGSPVLYYLAAAGVGTIGIADHDKVSISNLNRQILHTSADIGRKKVESGAEKLLSLNPEISIIMHDMKVTPENIAALLAGYNIVVDATDNFTSRFLISDYCFRLEIPLIEAGVQGFEGIILTIIPGETPCYRCLYPNPPEDRKAFEGLGIVGATAGIFGSLQALEVIKRITGAGKTIAGILVFDGLDGSFRNVKWSQRKDCPLCGQNPTNL